MSRQKSLNLIFLRFLFLNVFTVSSWNCPVTVAVVISPLHGHHSGGHIGQQRLGLERVGQPESIKTQIYLLTHDSNLHLLDVDFQTNNNFPPNKEKQSVRGGRYRSACPDLFHMFTTISMMTMNLNLGAKLKSHDCVTRWELRFYPVTVVINIMSQTQKDCWLIHLKLYWE